MINYIIPLLAAYLDTDFLEFWYFPMIALAFLISVPGIIRQIFRGGGFNV